MRIWWDDEEFPSVEVPLGAFFCNGFLKRANILALPINVNPSGGFNSYFPMPFRKRAKITIDNRNPADIQGFFYAVTFAKGALRRDLHGLAAEQHRLNGGSARVHRSCTSTAVIYSCRMIYPMVRFLHAKRNNHGNKFAGKNGPRDRCYR